MQLMWWMLSNNLENWLARLKRVAKEERLNYVHDT